MVLTPIQGMPTSMPYAVMLPNHYMPPQSLHPDQWGYFFPIHPEFERRCWFVALFISAQFFKLQDLRLTFPFIKFKNYLSLNLYFIFELRIIMTANPSQVMVLRSSSSLLLSIIQRLDPIRSSSISNILCWLDLWTSSFPKPISKTHFNQKDSIVRSFGFLLNFQLRREVKTFAKKNNIFCLLQHQSPYFVNRIHYRSAAQPPFILP